LVTWYDCFNHDANYNVLYKVINEDGSSYNEHTYDAYKCILPDTFSIPYFEFFYGRPFPEVVAKRDQ
jgi:hypothetical protein